MHTEPPLLLSDNPRVTESSTAFLDELRATGNVSAAARSANRARSCFYRDRQKDPVFSAAWADALEEAADRLEMEALRRAVDGVSEQRFFQGNEIGNVTRYSDGLLMFLLKARRPWRFDPHFRGKSLDDKDNHDAIRDEIERKMARLADQDDTG